MQYENTRLADYTDDASIGRGSVDLPLVLLTLLLLTIGVIMVLSASFARAYYDIENVTGGNAVYYFYRQLIFALGGVGVMFIASKFPLSFYRRFSLPLLFSRCFFCCWCLLWAWGFARLPAGWTWLYNLPALGDSQNCSILFFANLICYLKGRMSTLKYGVLPFVGIMGLVIFLLALSPLFRLNHHCHRRGDDVHRRGEAHLVRGRSRGAAGCVAILIAFSDYATTRIKTWIDLFANPTGRVADNTVPLRHRQRRLMGLGLGQSRRSISPAGGTQRLHFSVVCEELGFIRAVLILALFALLIIRDTGLLCTAGTATASWSARG